jgi:hypothetical protein
MNDVVRDTSKKERVNSAVDVVISYLNEICAADPFDDNLRYLKEEIEMSLSNYNDEGEQEEEEEEDVQSRDKEDIY